ncbi:MAG TPA: MiaB/RimO family radical SAM methylthiotransferase, partial [Candidatus Goldiibacteriota bacterium]|nr:MiaB/RimO family radical SAM methylthiotransferase [Candidatus Goldiibacteriota bacterium]
VVPNSGKFNPENYGLKPAADTALLLRGFSGRDKAFVKIEEGCDNFCAYCEVPYVRGGSVRSRPEEEVLLEIRMLVSYGFKEIVLTGINLGYYGKDRRSASALTGLLKRAVELPGDFRIRLSSIGPRETDRAMIELMASRPERICPHLHMSLQSGDDDILKSMGRNYSLDEYMAVMDYVLKKMPYAGITTDIIAGFPGETEKQHQNSLAFVRNHPFSRVHVFPYSDRPGTRASGMDGKVPAEEKKRRVKELLAAASDKEELFARKNIGRKLAALVESGKKGGFFTGYTENYIKVYLRADNESAGRLVQVIPEKIENMKVYCKTLTGG